MAIQNIYKTIGIEGEPSFGASRAGTANRLRVTSVSLNLDPTKSTVDDTTTSAKGRDRIVRTQNVIEGDISGFGTPRNLHYAFELVNGTTGVSVGLGGSTFARVMTYNQNTDGSMYSNTLQIDRQNTQEKYVGVVASELSLTASDNVMEWTLTTMGTSRAAGTALPDNVVGETVVPFTFADFTVTAVAGPTYTGSSAVTLKVSEWEINYANNGEMSWFSGNKNADRFDSKIPTLEGSFTIFHEGSTWLNSAFGSSEYYLRFEATLPAESGLINGETPFLLRIDVPRAQFMTNVRNYEQDEFATEEVEFTGLVNLGTSALWTPELTLGANI